MPGIALQLALAAVLEDERRADGEILDRAGDDNLARARLTLESRRDVHRQAREIPVVKLDLAGVHSGPDLEAEGTHGLARREGATDGLGGRVEAHLEAVARRLHLAAAVSRHRTPDDLVVPVEEIPPLLVSEPVGVTGGGDDVGDEDGRQDPFRLRARPRDSARCVDEHTGDAAADEEPVVGIDDVDRRDDDVTRPRAARPRTSRGGFVHRGVPDRGSEPRGRGRPSSARAGEA